MENPSWSQISDYAMMGNCRTVALVSNRGSIDWGCFPRFDSPSYFTRLLDPAGGQFALTPAQNFQSAQSYIDGTNVVQTRFKTGTGVAVLTDLISVKDRNTLPDELWPDQEILRIIEGESGEINYILDLHPRGAYGRQGLKINRVGNWGIKVCDGEKQFLLQSTIAVAELQIEDCVLGPRVRGRFKVAAGERVIVSLCYSEEAPAVMPPLNTAQERLNQTIAYWRKWSSRCPREGRYRGLVQRSALALKLLNFAPSGAFIAAPTTSLPEWIGGSRNWDYRFCWLRDASFTTRALLQVGQLAEAKSFLNWLLHSTRLTWPRLQVLYSVCGEAKIAETEAHWLSGYRGSQPVRIGNAASSQLQLDVYGEVIDSFYSLVEYLQPIDRETQKMVTGFGRTVAELWKSPDQGIWELRGKARHYTHSKVMCWVAMDRLAKLAQRFGWRLPYDPQSIAQEIKNEIESKGFNSALGTYTRSFDETELDASLLVMPLVGYCEASAPRFVATREAIIRKLSQNDLIYRFPKGSDGSSEPEGAFTICNFWLAEAFAMAGNLSEARRYFEAVIRTFKPTGLSAEEIDPRNQQQLGNFAQGFSHIGLIHAALAIQEQGRAAA